MQGTETFNFQSEVKQLLHLMIHSLYSKKEIFLRELISNAADATEKLRFQSLSTPGLYSGDLRLQISIDKEKRVLTLNDNGIGMQRNEVIENLGTIAKSGTKAFIDAIGSDQSKNNQLIGQFGVGFYSAFMVADIVSVRTRAAGTPSNQGVFWQSSGNGEYTIASVEKDDQGTEITLHLREGEDEFLDEWHVRRIVSKYSDHINLTIEIQTEQKKENGLIWEKINKAQALWTRKKTDITEDEYKEFYKHISNDFTDPLTWTHNKVEGKQTYINLLYVPSQAPWDMWSHDHKNGLKLYIQRVFIMDNAEQLMPNYLRFIKGLIDSNDLPLNVSREILQNSTIIKTLRGALIKRSLNMLEKLSHNYKEKYQTFWKHFGRVLKEGPAEDKSNIESITSLLRFSSTKFDDMAQTVSLNDYVNRMLPEQDKIYYITSDSYIAAKNSPYLEMFHSKKIEVLLLFDRIDEWMMNHLTEFKNKKFQSVSTSDDTLNKLTENDNEEQNKTDKSLEPFIKRIKSLLGTRVKDVSLTHRLSETPAIVTTDINDITPQMAKLFSASGQAAPEVKYLFELNPVHPLVRKAADIQNDVLFRQWIELFLDQALLTATGTLEDPNKFIRQVNQLLLK
ncbi:molecular chaperone HtpG [Candidatus Erwinia haradaeae]|uniref:Chaperone protein HtpG n=1 Tax=Candidatus Erwinia haradaeae TaxID=1922217 RepID=A0A451D7Q5_9GAMM|nr:molecular chaperone HtpG [Candidatus Erwinia haradaeae]VFP81803.1 Chaperone protein HtpG [Candidatus Erwinia haradaeae]